MPILACGINHKTAPVSLRERVMFSPEKLSLYLQDLVTQENIQEAVLLSTCNRSELYCSTDDIAKITDWFCRQHGVKPEELIPSMYFLVDADAIQHIMSVACGLDSMVLGESQILGQMKEAFSEACAAGSVDTLFNRLFQQVFMVAKEIRTHTAIGACPVSVSSAAVTMVKNIIQQPLTDISLLVIGAGATVDLVLRQFKDDVLKKTWIANRSIENAVSLAEKYSGDVIHLSSLPAVLSETDVVISATGGALPILTKSMIAPRKKPLIIVDIAVPRDVEPAVAEIEQVQLYSIDDLKGIIQQNLRGREHAAEKAHDAIKQKSRDFMTWLHSFQMVTTTISAYRKQIENLCHTELAKAKRQLQRGDNPDGVLSSFAHALTNKLLHAPSVQLRQAGYEGRLEILQLAQQLFAIPESKTESIT